MSQNFVNPYVCKVYAQTFIKWLADVNTADLYTILNTVLHKIANIWNKEIWKNGQRVKICQKHVLKL